jgi:thymidine kinase
LAHYSYRKSDQEDLVLLGEKQDYEPLSRGAFHEASAKRVQKKNAKKKKS